ncbi:MAG: LuxR C-terminal-related transcriptional regulator [Verrucomicrobiota bacterium]|nr:LuxR C-terminal-related transcriptional regulator [Verrucomicrobiota bacterium]
METLNHRDWLKLNDVVVDLHRAETLGELPARVIAGARHLFPIEAGSVQDDRAGLREIPWLFEDECWTPRASDTAPPRGVRMMIRRDPSFLPCREAFFALSGEKHPHTDYYRRSQDGSARRLSDLLPLRMLRQTAFYQELSRPQGINHQLTIFMPLTGGNTLSLAACRQGPDFSDREQTLLELLRPHVATAWNRAAREEASYLTSKPAHGRDVQRRLGAFKLTPRETEVLSWVSEGKTNPEIAVILGASPATVKTHVERILAKLSCETRTAAARMALDAAG